MRVALLMFYDDVIKEYGDITYKINKIYCNKYEIELIVCNNKTLHNRHSAWERLPLILKHIVDYEYIIWIDADAFFYTNTPNIIDIINNNKDLNFIFSKDIENNNINTGIMIIKNSQYSIDFINKWVYDEDLYHNNPYPKWFDQGVLIDMYNKNMLEIQNIQNSYCYDYGILQHFHDYELSDFAKKPLIHHLAGKNYYDRINISKNYYEKISLENKVDSNNLDNLINFEKESKEYESKNIEKQIYLDDLKQIIINSNTLLEGNCFYYHQSLNLYADLYTKQLNLFWCGKQAVSKICEIGFNAGHSALLMLLGRDTTSLHFTIFDIGLYPYIKPSLEYIKTKFAHVTFEYIEGDSTIVIPEWINKNKDKNKDKDKDKDILGTYDIVHVDGGHSDHCISNDMKNANMLVKFNGIVIIDDTNAPEINKYVNFYISTGNYIELNVLNTLGYQHRIIKKINKYI